MGDSLVVVIGVLAVLALGALVGARLSRRALRPLRLLAREIERLTPNLLLEGAPPRITDRRVQSAADHLWTVGRGLAARENELAAQKAIWQRRYDQATSLIDPMTEFNQVMHLGAVLERLSHGLSRFFAGDAVAIWIRTDDASLQLAASVAAPFPPQLQASDRWVEHLLAGESVPMLHRWVDQTIRWMAAPLFDAHGQTIGIVAMTSRHRSAYTAEDRIFLRTVIRHAAMAIQNATRYQFVDTLARQDPLTSLLNRREFDRRLGQAMAQSTSSGQPLSLMMIDADHFKDINDQLGHLEGDRALRELAKLILLVPRRPLDAAFRIGGEEFAILMTGTAKGRAMSAADALRRVVEQTKFSSEGARLTISLGVAALPEDGETPSALMEAADRALYRAKAVGRNRVQAA